MAIDALRPPLRGTTHMAAAGHYLAALAAYEILEAGGTAADAGVAAGLCMGVVQSDLVNIAGVAPILIREPGGTVVSIAGLGTWPAAADVEYFRKEHGGAIPHGVRRSIVPGAPAAWIRALRMYGRMRFADVARAAIRHARDGFAMDMYMAGFIARNREHYARWPSNAAIYLPGGQPPASGDVFRQTDLAATLQFMADEEQAAAGQGRDAGLQAAHDAFYRGDIARRIEAFFREQDGWLRFDDLAGFEARLEPVPSVRWGELTVHACGPWTQGPALLQALQLLPPAEMAALADKPVEWVHRIVEALKLAFADREAFYGDPRLVDVPLDRLLSDAHADRQRRRLDPARALGPAELAPPPLGEAADTSYACVIDRDGMVFSATPSDTSYDTPVVPGTGLAISSRGNQSWTTPGHPSVLAPGKRPRLTPNPAIAVGSAEGPDGWVMPFGTPGGDVQVQAMVQCLLNVTVRGMNPQAAVEAPRFATYSFPDSFEPHLDRPGLLKLERRWPQAVGDELAARGHVVEWFDDWDRLCGAVCLIEGDRRRGVLTGGADPRRSSYAAGR